MLGLILRQACLALAAGAVFFVVQTGALVRAQSPGQTGAPAAGHAPAQPADTRAARAYDAAVRQGPPALRAFLVQFPKGADLHVHLSGAVYAETFIRDAGEDGLCVDPAALKFVKGTCGEPLVPAARLEDVRTPGDQDLYDRLIDSFSMRSFVPSAGFSGHD